MKWFWQFLKLALLIVFILYGLKKFDVIDYDIMRGISESRVVKGMEGLFQKLEDSFSQGDIFKKVEQGSSETEESH